MKSVVAMLVAGVAFIFFIAFGRAVGADLSESKIIPERSMLTMNGIVTAPQRNASPIFTGNKLPMPPMQNAPWTPPQTDFPTNYISATADLFAQGMADPRGCDYREIEVGTGNVWSGDGGVVTTHGWVLPGNTAQKFAVCWNGMVYPAVSVGTNADLEADVATLETNGVLHLASAYPEAMTVSQTSLLGLKGCFLLRLGRTDLAMRLWLAEEHRARNFQNGIVRRFSQNNVAVSANEIKLSDADPYLNWAGDWAWTLFDRTICAHERGDEKLALLTARQLAKARPLIEADCAKRGFKRQPYYDYQKRGQEQPYLNFLGQFPELLADLERREKEGPHISIIATDITNVPDQTKRIAALVHDLDLAQAHQWGQPGGVNLAEAPVVSALIREGDAAVEPLMNSLEHDKRLTRSVSFGRDFFRGRNVLTVSNAADVALKTILQANFSSVAEMRAYWTKYGKLKIQDRWYSILKSDSARNRWLEAAANIVQPENVTRYPGGFSSETPAPANAPVHLRGEILRAKTNPSVTELLTQHALEVPTNNIGSYDLSTCCKFAEYLARWDSQAALPVAKTLSKRAATVMKYSGQQLGNFLMQFSLARAKAGDATAFDDYANWIVTTTPEQLGFSLPDYLEPMRKFPKNPALQSAAEKMFEQTNSSWSHLPWKDNRIGEVVDAALVAIPAYRTMLRRELEKTNVCGTISWSGNFLNYSISNFSSGGFLFEIPKELQPTNGFSTDLRWCDWIALSLSKSKKIPFFSPFAPITNRDEALAKAKTQLSKMTSQISD